MGEIDDRPHDRRMYVVGEHVRDEVSIDLEFV